MNTHTARHHQPRFLEAQPLRFRAELPALLAPPPRPEALAAHDFLVPNPRPDLIAERAHDPALPFTRS